MSDEPKGDSMFHAFGKASLDEEGKPVGRTAEALIQNGMLTKVLDQVSSAAHQMQADKDNDPLLYSLCSVVDVLIVQQRAFTELLQAMSVPEYEILEAINRHTGNALAEYGNAGYSELLEEVYERMGLNIHGGEDDE